MEAAAATPIVHGLFEVDGDDVTLLGGRSASSGHVHFPLADTCPYTGAQDIKPVALSRTGEVWAATTVRVAPPGYTGEVPFGLGVVELPEGVRVITRLLGVPEIGDEVVCVADEIATPEGPRIAWAFARREGDA